MKGSLYEGFNLEAGVRQGCPLSPIVYAMVAEVLLDKIEADCENVFVRAYADDTVLIIQDMEKTIPILEKLFEEFEAISGLRLNRSKSVIVPHADADPDNFARKLSRCANKWGTMQVDKKAKYLGFMMGPGKQESSWKKHVENELRVSSPPLE